jgi:hypothetical protein
MQAKMQPDYPLLYSVRGFQYCDLLLGHAERAAWTRLVAGGDEKSWTSQSLDACSVVAERAARTLGWVQSNGPLLTVAMDHLTLTRAALYQAVQRGDRPAGEHVREAVDFLRRGGEQRLLPLALLTRALFRVTTGDFDGAREDLDEAFEIAERGPMRLFLADIHLHRARLFGLIANRPAAYPWVSARDDLDKARRLIEDCGYGRRREELEDAEAAWERVYGAAAPGGAD